MAISAPASPRRILGLEWPRDVTPAERSSLVAGGLGWMLDAMDVMLYSLVLSHLMRDLGMGKAAAGALNSLTLLASALGGLVFGVVADRAGRTRALMVSILVYSVASGACGLSRTIATGAMMPDGADAVAPLERPANTLQHQRMVIRDQNLQRRIHTHFPLGLSASHHATMRLLLD